MRNKLLIFLASGCGLGFSPLMPGTFGTLPGILLALVFPDNVFLIMGVCVLGIWVANEAEKILGEHDSPKIVIDEIAGFLIAAYHWNGFFLVAAFILFRVFDIVKPGPLKSLQKLPGGLGIMVDDIAAGLLANISLVILSFVF